MFIFRESWVDCQALRRDSRGWEDWSSVVDGGVGASDERSVSWMPGAEGAPLFVEEEVFVVEVEWLELGTILRDCAKTFSRGFDERKVDKILTMMACCSSLR